MVAFREESNVYADAWKQTASGAAVFPVSATRCAATRCAAKRCAAKRYASRSA
jgi:hypothetical protein